VEEIKDVDMRGLWGVNFLFIVPNGELKNCTRGGFWRDYMKFSN